MSEYNSSQPFQFEGVGSAEKRYAGDAPAVTPFNGSSNGVFTTGYLINSTGTLPPPVAGHSLAPRTDHLLAAGPLHDVPTTQSLITALQSTMVAPRTKGLVVIPGKRRRSQATEELAVQPRMSLHLRHGVVVAALFLMFVTTLVSLAPLGAGQSKYTIFGSAAQWVQAQQDNWSVASRASQQDQLRQTQQNGGDGLPPMSLPKSQYIAIARQDAIDAGISPDYFVRQINQESGFDPRAVSGAGAVGIAQFIPSTAQGLGIDPWDPIQALRGAAQLMATNARQYGGDYAKALAAYNAGGGVVDRAVSMGGAYWMNYLPAETRNYIRIIMGI